MKYLKIILINLIVVVLLIEVVSMIFIKVKHPEIADYQRIPTYLDIMFEKDKTFKNVLSGTGDSITLDPLAPRNIDTLYPWCTWHPKNRFHREVYPCFDVMYKFNAMGTRGPLPEPADSNTIFFIGDSYVEGFGLDEDSTISQRIHRQLKKPALNLGTSGHFSPTQMSLVYDDFAKKFSHKDVYVFFYLENDFIENNIDNHYKTFSNRYRPYRVLTEGGSSKIVYNGSIDSTEYSWKHFSEVTKKGFAIFPPEEKFMTKLTKLTFTRRCIHMLKSNFKSVKTDVTKPGELRYSVTDMALLEKDIESILATAAKQNARVTFVNLPSRNLLNGSMESPGIAKEYHALELKLKNLAEKGNGHYISFFDYLIEKKMKPDLLYFPCDFHYSNYGESLLSDFIAKNYINK